MSPSSVVQQSKDITQETEMDKYTNLCKELKSLIQQKRGLDKKLASIEEEIFQRETIYLEDSLNGNMVKGFDNYTRSSANNTMKRRNNLSNEDRIFSLSSATYIKHLQKKAREAEREELRNNEQVFIDTPPTSDSGLSIRKKHSKRRGEGYEEEKSAKKQKV